MPRPEADPPPSGSALVAHFEGALAETLVRATGPGTPPRLREALLYATAGGGRLRPLLCLTVAGAYGDPIGKTALAAAVAVEFVHCASLAHDDLPSFDDADLRRGKPSVHKKFGQPTAILVGDALIVLAFEALGRSGSAEQIALLARATGPSRGLVAGQAWEQEPGVPLDEYHAAKTAALFGAASGMAALAIDAPVDPWRAFGEAIGRAYQAADDLADAMLREDAAGKTTGRDALLGRPSLVRAVGVDTARSTVARLVSAADQAIPECVGKPGIEQWLQRFRERIGA